MRANIIPTRCPGRAPGGPRVRRTGALECSGRLGLDTKGSVPEEAGIGEAHRGRVERGNRGSRLGDSAMRLAVEFGTLVRQWVGYEGVMPRHGPVLELPVIGTCSPEGLFWNSWTSTITHYCLE